MEEAKQDAYDEAKKVRPPNSSSRITMFTSKLAVELAIGQYEASHE